MTGLTHSFTLKNHMVIPRMGQGTWYLGQNIRPIRQEIETLRWGIDLGMTLIDTAEMYGDGAAESLVGTAISHVEREKLFLVSKVYPHNAGRKRLEKSLNASLRRLGTEYLDMYLLHWRGSIPLRETAECMERQVEAGKIRSWGVSNLDLQDMQELMDTGLGEHCMVDQVLYHLGSRGVEYELQPWLENKQIGLMAYCPLAQGGSLRRGLLENATVQKIAYNHNATGAQVLLNFVLQRRNVIAVPKASTITHVEENAKALKFSLDDEELQQLNQEFPAPDHRTKLDIV